MGLVFKVVYVGKYYGYFVGIVVCYVVFILNWVVWLNDCFNVCFVGNFYVIGKGEKCIGSYDCFF